jgi:hypothetical protein
MKRVATGFNQGIAEICFDNQYNIMEIPIVGG